LTVYFHHLLKTPEAVKILPPQRRLQQVLGVAYKIPIIEPRFVIVKVDFFQVFIIAGVNAVNVIRPGHPSIFTITTAYLIAIWTFVHLVCNSFLLANQQPDTFLLSASTVRRRVRWSFADHSATPNGSDMSGLGGRGGAVGLSRGRT